jgi:glutamate-1-semialdehyde 2,1-aminomutase
VIDLLNLANKYTPGGVHSPVRACKNVGLEPIFWQGASGCFLQAVNGDRYLDYICGFGPVLLGHDNAKIVNVVQQQAQHGMIYGGCDQRAPVLSEMICNAFFAMDKVRLMNSGTEACMTAVRLARAYTGRNKVIKCQGSYHGHSDSFLVAAGSGALTGGKPSSDGVTIAAAQDTILVPFNDIASIEALLQTQQHDVAAIILEPICGNMGMIVPQKNYLQNLRAICDKYDICLIFDEVMTGFRVAYGGAQVLYSVRPDITVLGKIIGGGLPIGAVGGRADILDQLAPVGGVYQAGTFSANPMSVAAGIAALEQLNTDVYCSLEKYTEVLTKEMQSMANRYNIPLQTNYKGGMLGVFFSAQPIYNLEDTSYMDVSLYNEFYRQMLKEKIVLPPSAYEAWFVTTEHDDAAMQMTLAAVEKAFSSMQEMFEV